MIFQTKQASHAMEKSLHDKDIGLENHDMQDKRA
jgi:hypothetical protein